MGSRFGGKQGIAAPHERSASRSRDRRSAQPTLEWHAAFRHKTLGCLASEMGQRMHRKILIMGLPGAGKTTLARCLAPRLNAVHFNADDVRTHINRDLGFSEEDRIEHARRMGWLCDQVVKVGCFAVADFICPTPATRAAFLGGGPAFVIFVDRIRAGAFADTNRMFVPPDEVDLRVEPAGTPEYWAEAAMTRLRPVFDPKKPTALFVGRYQPFHAGHRALIVEGLRRTGQACVAVRHTHGIDDKNPYDFEYVRARIEHSLREFEGRFLVVPLPNITDIFYGRDVGYTIERIELDAEVETISATQVRKAEHSGIDG
jgi:adenylylsulfate kinase